MLLVQDALQQAMRDKVRVEDAYTSTCASLNSVRRKAEQLRHENKAFMANYDSYLHGLMGSQGPHQQLASLQQGAATSPIKGGGGVGVGRGGVGGDGPRSPLARLGHPL